MSFSSDPPGTPCLTQEEEELPKVKLEAVEPVPSLDTKQEQDNASSSLYLDDVDRMLCHEDFPSLLALCVRVKQVRESISLHVPNRRAASEMDPQQVISAVSRMQQQHLLRNYQDAPVIKRGTYHMTDSLLNENFHILQQEMERCNKYIEAAAKEKRQVENSKVKKSKAEGGDAIAVKYAKWQTDLLMEWMLAHVDHPFPDQHEMKHLCQITGLSHAQVVNWTTNVRKRSLKATVENGKKPHHFIDFCFLAKDRERRHTEKKQAAAKKSIATKHKKKVQHSNMVRPYTTAIHGGHASSYQQQQQQQHASQFRLHPSSGTYYAMHPQTMVQHHHAPRGYYPAQQQQQPPQQQPAQPYQYPPLYQPQQVVPQYNNDEQRQMQGEADWENKVRAVSESFDESNNVDDPLLAFAHLWGDDELRDDVLQEEDFEPEELEDATVNMDIFMNDVPAEDPQLEQDGFSSKEVDRLLQQERRDYGSGTDHIRNGEPLLRDEMFGAFEETTGVETEFRAQRRGSSFSIDMQEFEQGMNVDDDEDMDITDFLVQV